jgi:SPP1 family predicted phage head-tail adaptor
MYGLSAGRLKKKIHIYGYKETDNPLGGEKVILTEKSQAWAEIKPLRGTEFLEYYRDANALQYKVTIRYRKGITEKDILVYQNRQFEINSIININEENVTLEIYCTERKDKVII